MGVNDDDAASLEARHVHHVYEAIAAHFSSTRYKVRRVSRFPGNRGGFMWGFGVGEVGSVLGS